VITGASSGLGLASARQLAARGAQVVLAVRNRDRGNAAAEQIRADVPDADLEIADLDVADLGSVRAFAETQRDRDLDVLINNAGISMVPSRRLSADGFELQHATNVLGHFALVGELLPTLEGRSGRVVWLSSVMALVPRHVDPGFGIRGHYNPSWVYAQTKLACGVLGLELDRRLKASNRSVISVLAHPGWSNTGLFAREQGFIPRTLHRFGAPLGSDAEDGAASQVYAATAGLDGGEYIGPRWVGRGRPWKIRPRRLMSSPESGRELWTAAEQATGTTLD
jgi:NAD(P)-dependent dehydrogenase (short-subunit alcohol dehydrogenase family)